MRWAAGITSVVCVWLGLCPFQSALCTSNLVFIARFDICSAAKELLWAISSSSEMWKQRQRRLSVRDFPDPCKLEQVLFCCAHLPQVLTITAGRFVTISCAGSQQKHTCKDCSRIPMIPMWCRNVAYTTYADHFLEDLCTLRKRVAAALIRSSCTKACEDWNTISRLSFTKVPSLGCREPSIKVCACAFFSSSKTPGVDSQLSLRRPGKAGQKLAIEVLLPLMQASPSCCMTLATMWCLLAVEMACWLKLPSAHFLYFVVPCRRQ